MGLLKYYDESTSQWKTIALGSTGEQGPEGPQGLQGPEGPQGIEGVPGEQGLQGDPGIIAQNVAPEDTDVLWLDTTEDGIGMPSGGDAGQVLAKIDSEDFNSEWIDVYTQNEIDSLLGDKSDTSHDHDDRYYTESETDAAISSAIADLVDTAPGTLDTLNELAAALGDDENFATTVTTALSEKSDVGHEHNDIYYTETETDNLLSTKAESSHTHTASEITDTENITAGKIYSGGTISGAATTIYVQASEPTGASIGDLWFWGS
jgi:hypothetical protein